MDFDSDDDYIVDLESDQEEAADSSDDEIEIVLHGTPEQRRKLEKQFDMQRTKSPKLKRKKSGKGDESSEDEFEKEMTADLDTTMSAIEQEHKTIAIPGNSTVRPQNEKRSNEAPGFYDNSYFDSDSDDEGTAEEKKTRKRPVLSNDDLLYDPNADNDDQRWVDSQRRLYQPKKLKQREPAGQKPPNKPERLPNSDAVLNCPACMVQLCLDCQRHETYNNQYRAMFVMNCSVNYEQRLKFPKQRQQGKKKKKQARDMTETTAASATEDGEFYHPVKCSQCTTEVGVFDRDEVFHFFNVLASHS